jgi:hypothetical protein
MKQAPQLIEGMGDLKDVRVALRTSVNVRARRTNGTVKS